MANENLTWTPIDTDDLPNDLAKLYNALKAKQQEAANARGKFEDALTAKLEKSGKVPAGTEPAYGYRFGRVAVAFRKKTERKTAREALKL